MQNDKAMHSFSTQKKLSDMGMEIKQNVEKGKRLRS